MKRKKNDLRRKKKKQPTEGKERSDEDHEGKKPPRHKRWDRGEWHNPEEKSRRQKEIDVSRSGEVLHLRREKRGIKDWRGKGASLPKGPGE